MLQRIAITLGGRGQQELRLVFFANSRQFIVPTEPTRRVSIVFDIVDGLAARPDEDVIHFAKSKAGIRLLANSKRDHCGDG